MTLANFCIIAAGLLPIACAGLAKFGSGKRGFDNREPRTWLAKLSGWPARANAAQANSFEALPLFIAGVLAAQQMQAPQATVDGLALGFIAARLAYIGCYLGNQASLRSLVWLIGLACSVALFFSAR